MSYADTPFARRWRVKWKDCFLDNGKREAMKTIFAYLQVAPCRRQGTTANVQGAQTSDDTGKDG